MTLSPVLRDSCRVLLVLAMSGSTASFALAATPADFATVTPIRAAGSSVAEQGYARTFINATSFKLQSLATVAAPNGDTYQFVSYYDAAGRLVVGRRKLLAAGWSNWDLDRTAFTSYNINDAHNVSTLAIDGAGRLHLAWGLHCNPVNYAAPRARC